MKLTKTLLGAAAAAMLSLSASAVPITGGISETGNFVPNNANLLLATQITLGAPAFVTAVAGSYVGVVTPGAVVIWNTPLIISPITPLVPLWTVTGLASFDLTSFLIDPTSTSDALTLRGTGVLHLLGFDNTAGTWIATFNTAGGTFSFSSSNGAVPDGGTTIVLLGSALSGMAWLNMRRKK